ncbi:MAG: type IV toxin-antitoxin system AbiEi family antitoxin domain-containing protein [Solirubrobacterales bacterium]
MGRQGRTVEERIAGLAGDAHGVVTRPELLAAGITRKQIDVRVRNGLLIAVHRGVYRVGHRAPSLEARYLAAVKAAGTGALLAARAAGHLWGLLKGSPPPPEVLAATERRIPGVIVHRARGSVHRARRTVHRARRTVHRARRGELADATTIRKIPVTTVPRTVVDLAAYLPEKQLARACHEAGVLHRATPAQVAAVLERRPTSPGARTLRRILLGDVRVSLSALESRFLTRLADAALPLPETNRPAGGRRVDCRWPDQRLTVELDGYRYHHSRHAWEQDRRREREARARGDVFRRYTYADVFEDPRYMLRELTELLPPGPS